jgi:hypothetical protein
MSDLLPIDYKMLLQLVTASEARRDMSRQQRAKHRLRNFVGARIVSTVPLLRKLRPRIYARLKAAGCVHETDVTIHGLEVARSLGGARPE